VFFGLYGVRNILSYTYNATQNWPTTIGGSGAGTADQYVSLGFEIREIYENYQTSDGYHSWINMMWPVLQTMNLSSSGPQDFYTVIGRFEPCRNLYYYYDFSLVREIQHFPSNLTVKVKIEAIIEGTLIPYLPFTENILDNDEVPFTTEYYGDQRYRTIKINPGDYENKDLVIKLSVPVYNDRNISSLIKELIFASGDQCIWTYNISSEDRFVREVPEDSGRSWNVTVPAKDIWYIAFVTKFNRDDFQVDYLLVDRFEKPEPTSLPSSPYPPSSSYIPCLDFNLIVVLILSVLIFQK